MSEQQSAVVVPTIEHTDQGWFVICRCPDGVVRRVGPFDSKGRAWWFAWQRAMDTR